MHLIHSAPRTLATLAAALAAALCLWSAATPPPTATVAPGAAGLP